MKRRRLVQIKILSIVNASVTSPNKLILQDSEQNNQRDSESLGNLTSQRKEIAMGWTSHVM